MRGCENYRYFFYSILLSMVEPKAQMNHQEIVSKRENSIE